MTRVRENRFLRKPTAGLDEDGDWAYVDVTSETDTADKARAWVVANPDELFGSDVRLVLDRIGSPPELGLTMLWPGLLPEVWHVERLVQTGLCQAWWRLDISTAREEIVEHGFSWECPGCGHSMGGAVGPEPVSGWDNPVWQVMGTAEAPTLTPSLGCPRWREGTCTGHWWLRDGRLVVA